jgi:hypothetical protein
MMQVGDHRVFTADAHSGKEGMEFIIRNIIVHNESGDTYAGCEFFYPIPYGHNLSVGSGRQYSGYYNEPCPEECGSYFSIQSIKEKSKLIKAPEPDWEV